MTRKFIARLANRHIWPKIIHDRHNPLPNDNDWIEHERKSKDGLMIFGRCLRAPGNARGTIIMAHGFTTNGKMFTDRAYNLREMLNMHVIIPDFRHHGRSHNRIPTFGTAEAWDLATCLDCAEEYGLPRPYILIGDSLGAMAVQRLLVEDHRIDYAICVHPPGWPWDAIGKNVQWTHDNIRSGLPVLLRPVFDLLLGPAVSVGNLINSEYDFDVLKDGDPRSHSPNPPGNPKILYVWGMQDGYDYNRSLEVWEHFYPELRAEKYKRPAEAPEQRKYFIVVDGFCHYPPGPTVWEWHGFWDLIWEFLGEHGPCSERPGNP